MNSKLIKCISIMLVVVTMFTLASCSLISGGEEEETTEPAIVALTPLPSSKDEALSYFNRLVNQIKVVNPAVATERRRDIKDVSAQSVKGEVKEVGSLVELAKGYMEVLDKQSDSREYGTNLNDFLPVKDAPTVSTLTSADIISAECTVKEDNDDYYVINIVLNDAANPDAASNIAKAFDLDIDKSTVLEQFQGYTNSITVSDYSTLYTGCSIYAEVFKGTDQITYLAFNKNVIVTSDVVFNGKLASWGESTVTLTFTEERKFKDFVWDEPTTVIVEE